MSAWDSFGEQDPGSVGLKQEGNTREEREVELARTWEEDGMKAARFQRRGCVDLISPSCLLQVFM